MRLLAVVLAAGILAGCTVDDPAETGRPTPDSSSSAAEDDLAAHTPNDLRHPCQVVPARTAGRVLGERVTARAVSSDLAPRTLTCRYVPDARDSGASFLEIQSTPDPTSLDALVRLYVGVDRLPHHPVQVDGADDAEVVLQPDGQLVSVFAKQGFVTHSVILGIDDLQRGEPIALRLARLVVRANR